ncbi:FliI/YscN family ATPase [bacterium]|nr:FliI/YscN family ATPase [candidate division CSSED10-310 bacterium]
MNQPHFDSAGILEKLESASPLTARGRITEVVGLVIRAAVPGVRIGELCRIEDPGSDSHTYAEVAGFKDNQVILMALERITGIGPDSVIFPTGRSLRIRVGEHLLGRVLDALGRPLDGCAVDSGVDQPVMAPPPAPLQRQLITSPLQVGIKAIDGLLTCGEGQRMGFFGAAGGGKSTLLGMIARNTSADVNVIGLIGERGREVREFIEHSLGDGGLEKSILVVSTSDQPAMLRIKSAYVATAIAEYFRDRGKRVLLMMDSITRFARALREVGLAIGEPPAREGYPPSVFSTLPRLLERAGTSQTGSITGFYTVLVAGDDLTEPIADEVMSILDGHIILSRELGARGHYPAIDVLRSKSRVMSQIVSPRQLQAARNVLSSLAVYEKERDFIHIGAYKTGSNPVIDTAISAEPAISRFLRQAPGDLSTFPDTVDQLCTLAERHC